jgi:homoserine kinase
MKGQARVFAPATIGNVGPGFDVLGAAVDGLGDTVSVMLGVKTPECRVLGRDADAVPRALDENTAAIAARAYLLSKKYTRPFSITIEKGLPLSGGLGGSAASSVGGALAAAHALAKPFKDTDILAAAAEGEAHAAGWHFDNLARASSAASPW